MGERLAIVPIWLSALARELNEPDKWDEWERAKAGLLIEAADIQSDQTFTEVERLRLIGGLTELREKFSHIEAPPETLSRIESMLDSAVEEVKKSSSKVSLQYFLMGLLITIISLFGHSPILREACVKLMNEFITKVPFLFLALPPPVG
jgi:hypothetical protein